MGVFKHISNITKANINSLLDNCENPSKMVDQYLQEMIDGLAEVRKESASVIAEEDRLKRLIDNNITVIAKYENLARKALTKGEESDARVFLEQKQLLMDKARELQASYDVAHADAQKIRDTYDRLIDSIETLRQRRDTIKAKVTVAKVQQKANKLMNANIVMDVIGNFDRMDTRADTMLDQANAIEELDNSSTIKVRELEKKYGTIDKSAIDDEIARLKSELLIS